MKIIIVVTLFIVMMFAQVKALIAKDQWGEVIIVLTSYIIGLTLSLLLMKDIPIPNPHDGIVYLVKLISF